MKKKEILFIYNSQKENDLKARGYVSALKDHIVNDRDISRDNLTETQLAELSDILGMPVRDLLDKNSILFMEEVKGKDLENKDLLKLLHRDPGLLITPILISEDKQGVLKSPYDLVKMDFEIEGVTSDLGNLDEKF